MKCAAAVVHGVGQNTLAVHELITDASSLDDNDVGDQTMRDGENIRAVVVHPS